MVGNALREAVQWVEGVRGVGCGHDPFVMRFVEALVEDWVVEAAVDPIDAKVGEADEGWEL